MKKTLKAFEKEFFHGIGSIRDDKGQYPIFNILVIEPEKLKYFDLIFNVIDVPDQNLEEMNINMKKLVELRKFIDDQKNKIEDNTQGSLETLNFWWNPSEEHISELNQKKDDYLATFDTILEEQINSTSEKINIDPELIKKMICYGVGEEDNTPLIPLKSTKENMLQKSEEKKLVITKKED